MSDLAAAVAELDRLAARVDDDDDVSTAIDAVCAQIDDLGPGASPAEGRAAIAAFDRLEAAVKRQQERSAEQLATLRAARRASIGYAPLRPQTTSQRLNVKV